MTTHREWLQDLVDEFVESVLGTRAPADEPARIPVPVDARDRRPPHRDDRS